MSAHGAGPEAPSADGRDGRTGRFLAGNRAGRGNPQARRVAALRAVLLREVTGDDLRAVVRALIDKAKRGDVAAIREVLDRAVGKPTDWPIDKTPAGRVQVLVLPNANAPRPVLPEGTVAKVVVGDCWQGA